MPASFFFYDLETSGFDPRYARVMQFAGQRTDMKLRPVGEPVNILIKLTPDTLPDPDAILVTGITPQMTIADGVTEAEFLKQFYADIVQPATIFVGFNSIRFDDEFMRYLHYRNFYDPYEWHWCDECSRWDMLDVVRMTRALRPEGIVWPYASDGSPSNKLELLSAVNKLEHVHAHDALSDVEATIAVARLIQERQPKLFSFLLEQRAKRSVATFVRGGKPFVYTSGSYPSEFHKTSVATMVIEMPRGDGAVIFDLRYDPVAFANLSVAEWVKLLRWQPGRDAERPVVPVKILRFNKCPAVAPLSVLDVASRERLHLSLATVEKHKRALAGMPELAKRVLEAYEAFERDKQGQLVGDEMAVDGQLYDGFFDDGDRIAIRAVRAMAPQDLSVDAFSFHDQRLDALLPLYKARNYPKALTSDERVAWERFRTQRLMAGGAKSRLQTYFERLDALGRTSSLTQNQRYLLEELKLYGESIVPTDE